VWVEVVGPAVKQPVTGRVYVPFGLRLPLFRRCLGDHFKNGHRVITQNRLDKVVVMGCGRNVPTANKLLAVPTTPQPSAPSGRL